MRKLALLTALSVLVLGNVACASKTPTATAPAADGPQYASASPVVADTPEMVRREGSVPEISALRSSGPDQLEQLLGEPTLRHRGLKAEMWQYASPECVLLLFLYPNGGGAYQVTHLEASPGGTSDGALSECAEAAAHRPLPASS
jgi:hypothetical protein